MEAEEHAGFERFAKLAGGHVAPLFEAKGVLLSIEYVTATELMKDIEYETPHREKLERYVV